jgi:hypothetical protein
MKKETILLGIKNNQIITTDLEITERNGYPEFSACFNCGDAFNINDINDDYKNDYYESLWECYDAESKLKELWDGERTKTDVFEDWGDCDDYHDVIDCSCTDYEIDHNEKTINFESTCGGQHDVREENDFKDMTFTNKKMFDKIMYYWDNYHLKEVNEEQQEEIKKIMNSDYSEYSDKFYEFIEKNIDWEVL